LLAFLTVVFWFPFCFQRGHPLATTSSGTFLPAQEWLAFWPKHRMAALIILAVVLALTIKGLANLKINDNPTALSLPDAALMAEDNRIRELIGAGQTHGNIVVTGKTAEEALQNMEGLQDVLTQAEARGWIEPTVSLAYFLPSKKRQEEDARMLTGLLTYEDEIKIELDALGLPEENIQKFFLALRNNQALPILPETWLSNPVSEGLRDMWLGKTSDGVALLVQLRQVHAPAKFKAAIAGLPGVVYFNQEEDLTRLLGRYRVSTIWLVTIAYSLVFALLFWRYGWRGIALVLPCLLSASITVGMIGLCGSPFTLMHCLALLLVLGMGLDYAIFFAEADPKKDSITFLCTVLCCATTVLSFGMLSLSSQAALHAIGLTTVIGIISAWLLAPIAIYARRTA
jgi:predicted exporter